MGYNENLETVYHDPGNESHVPICYEYLLVYDTHFRQAFSSLATLST